MLDYKSRETHIMKVEMCESGCVKGEREVKWVRTVNTQKQQQQQQQQIGRKRRFLIGLSLNIKLGARRPNISTKYVL